MRKLKRLIKEKKKSCWAKFLEEQGHRHPLEVIRLARDPFGTMKAMGDLRDEQGDLLPTDQDKVKAFQDSLLVGDTKRALTQRKVTSKGPARAASERALAEVEEALNGTKNSSSPAPDQIPYKLMKLIRHTKLGKACLNLVARVVETGRITMRFRDMEMVMIPKPNKDLEKVKGWRPIVLANTMGKLADKVVANRIQPLHKLFHKLQYDCRKGRSESAGDAMMITMSKVERAMKGGSRATLLGKDVVSAFNNLRKEGTLEALAWAGVDRETLNYTEAFFESRYFYISWDGDRRGEGRMDQGTPQGSPLSPVL